ncbi:MAG: hypothetical protein V4760_08085 [Bdellovibrionota bacterium]
MTRPTSNVALTILTVLFLGGCDAAEFRMHAADSAGRLSSPGTQSPYVCDPFEATTAKANEGLRGSIHYLDASQPRYTVSSDYVTHGHELDAELYLSRVFAPTRVFDAGFTTDASKVLQDANGQLLFEYFAFNLESQIKLASGVTDGLYLLAIISDVGATLLAEDSSGAMSPLVANEGAHATQMACATQAVAMNSSSRLPISLSYFQGPRHHIAFVLMWRRVANAAGGLNETECGKSGSTYFFSYDAATKTSVPQPAYQDLLARGWKPLAAQNFELASGVNLCAR